MSAASLYRAAMLTYPSSYRRAHGAELADTAGELAGGRWSARQASSLVIEGLRTRLRLASGGSPRQAWAGGLALALMLSQLESLATLVSFRLNPPNLVYYEVPFALSLLVVAVPVLALAATTRWPAAAALAAVPIVWLVVAPDADSSVGTTFILVSTAPRIVMAAVIAVVGNGRRALPLRWSTFLLAVMVGVGIMASPLLLIQVTLAVGLLALPALGLALVWVDPRPLAAASGLWLLQGMSGAWILWLPGAAAASAAGASLGLGVAWWAGRRLLSAAG